MQHNPFVKYRPDIDGLRAVAVLSVVAFHAFPDAIHGGFIGVDIFFVISGYLISSIVFEGLEKDKFSFIDFYKRRTKRIFPALLLVLSTCFAVGWLYLFRSEFEQLGKHIFAGAGFISNIALMQEVGYFDTTAELKPLLHLWSLGIEEQFYIFWPVFLWIMFNKNLQIHRGITIAIVASFLASVSGFFTSGHAFFLPFTRFWELMSGGLMAYLHQPKGRDAFAKIIPEFGTNGAVDLRRTLPHVGSLLGIVLIIASLLYLNRDLAKINSGWWALPSIIGAILVIASGPNAWVNKNILSSRLLVFFGLVSYPLYLWHWPLLSFARIIEAGNPSIDLRIFLVLVSVILAYLTYWFIERPVRRATSYTVPIALASGMAIICIMGVLVTKSILERSGTFDERDKFVASFDNRDYRYIRANNLTMSYRFQCDFYDFLSNTHRSSISQECVTPGTGKNILLWGDSHAQAIFTGLRSSLPQSIGIMQITTSGCNPSLFEKSDDEFGSCNRSNRLAIEIIERLKPNLVIIAQRFHHEQTEWGKLASRLRKLGAGNVVLVGPSPQWDPALNVLLARKYWPEMPMRLFDGLIKNVADTERILKSTYNESSELTYVSLFDLFCNEQGCQTKLDSKEIDDLVTWDYGHLTIRASEYVGQRAFLPVVSKLISIN